MTQQLCRLCSAETTLERQDYLFAECGLDNVVLQGAELRVCPACGARQPRIARQQDLLLTIAVALIAKPALLTGEEVRYLRRFAEDSIEQMARKLGVDRSHLSRIENGATPISRQTDRLVRTLLLLFRPELQRKLEALDSLQLVLQRMEEIRPESEQIPIALRLVEDQYSFEQNSVAA